MIKLATKAQEIELDALTYEAWGQTLTMSGYGERQRRLRSHPWARDALCTWLLMDSSGAILSSCETFRMNSFMRRREGDAAAHLPSLSRAESYGIASVYTEPRLRGRGYAVRLMSVLIDRIRELDSTAQAMVLYSDVGASLYERAGYVAVPAYDRVFLPSEGDPAEGVELVDEADLDRAFSLIPRPDIDFLLWPTSSQIDWHLERERVYSSCHRRARPLACGARVGGSSILWYGGFKTNELSVLLLHAESPSELSLLFRSACRVAHRAGFSRVVCWESSMPFEWPEALGSRSLREDSLPMICPLSPFVSPSSFTVIPRALWV